MSLFGLIKRQKYDDVKLPSTPVLRELPDAESTPPPAAAGPSSSELRQLLFDAIAKGDETRITELCREHRQFVQDYAPRWLIVPDSLRANPAAAKWYGRGLRQVLQQFCTVPSEPAK
jgi:hypothetical protein